MLEHIRDMEKLLAQKGIEVRPYSKASDDSGAADNEPPPENQGWIKSGTLWIRGDASEMAKTRFKLRNDLHTRPGAKLAVGEDNDSVSSMRGSVLTIMGATIHTNDIAGPDFDEPPPNTGLNGPKQPLYNKSLRAFHRTCLAKQPPPDVELPDRNLAFQYVEWYFLAVGRFVMVLHKPTVLRIVSLCVNVSTVRTTVY